MITDLASKRDRLADEVPAVAGQKLDLVVGRVVGRLGEPEAVDGGAVDGGDVGVVGLVAGVGGLAELLGGERMDDADLEAGGGEGVADDVMIPSGALDDDDQIDDPMLDRGSPNLLRGGLESRV